MKWKIYGIVFPIVCPNVCYIPCAREVFAKLMKRSGHYTVCGIEGLLDAVTMVNIDIDVEHALMVSAHELRRE